MDDLRRFVFNRQSLSGVPVTLNPLLDRRPKLRVCDHFEWMTEGARAAMNDWLLEMFGTTEPQIWAIRDPFTFRQSICMGPAEFERLKRIEVGRSMTQSAAAIGEGMG